MSKGNCAEDNQVAAEHEGANGRVAYHGAILLMALVTAEISFQLSTDR